MNLQDVSFAMRAAADVARAGENLLVSMDRSRRAGALPLLFGVAVGIGIGAVVLRKETRARVLDWLGVTIAPARTANGTNATTTHTAATSAQA